MPIRQETHEPPSIDSRPVLRPLDLRNRELGRAITKSQRQTRQSKVGEAGHQSTFSAPMPKDVTIPLWHQ